MLCLLMMILINYYFRGVAFHVLCGWMSGSQILVGYETMSLYSQLFENNVSGKALHYGGVRVKMTKKKKSVFGKIDDILAYIIGFFFLSKILSCFGSRSRVSIFNTNTPIQIKNHRPLTRSSILLNQSTPKSIITKSTIQFC